MSKYVKEVQLFNEVLEIKDEWCRNQLNNISSDITNIVINNVASAKRYGDYCMCDIKGRLLAINDVVNSDINCSGDGTYNSPYTTLNEVINLLNKGETHLKIHITLGGVYVINKRIISDCAVVLYADADDIEIILNDDDHETDFTVFNSYFYVETKEGVKNLKIHTPSNSNKLYTHNSSLFFNRISYDGCIVSYGSYVNVYSSDVGRLELSGCNGHLYNNKITNKDNRYNGITIVRGSNMELGGADADFADLNETGGSGASMLRIEGATCALQYAQNANTNYEYGITCNSSTLYCTQVRLDSFANSCANGNNITNTVLVTGNIEV